MRQLVDGYAECFGTELATRVVYLFGGECKAVIYTHRGCTIEISLSRSSLSYYHRGPLPSFVPYVYGEPATEYASEETAMGHYQSASVLFEQMRVLSLATAGGAMLDGLNPQNIPATPPHILVLGPENSGKTTLCKTLIDYAVRGEHDEWSPILVNVDPGDVRDLGPSDPGLLLTVPSTSRAHGLFPGAFPPPPYPPPYLLRRLRVRWGYRRQQRQQFGPLMH